MPRSRQFTLISLFAIVSGCSLLMALLTTEGGRTLLLFILAYAFLFAPLYLSVVASLLSRWTGRAVASAAYLLFLYAVSVSVACFVEPNEKAMAIGVLTVAAAILWSVEFFFLWSVDRLFKYCFPSVVADDSPESPAAPRRSD